MRNDLCHITITYTQTTSAHPTATLCPRSTIIRCGAKPVNPKTENAKINCFTSTLESWKHANGAPTTHCRHSSAAVSSCSVKIRVSAAPATVFQRYLALRMQVLHLLVWPLPFVVFHQGSISLFRRRYLRRCLHGLRNIPSS